MTREKRDVELKVRVTPTTAHNLRAVAAATGKPVAVLASDYTTMQAAKDAKELGNAAGPSSTAATPSKD